ncbi:MAG: hypothetical protein H6Q60_451 [Oscillospiraceae bacterium]|nr:hypothetical protein [Oscillospiraceae bacterium]
MVAHIIGQLSKILICFRLIIQHIVKILIFQCHFTPRIVCPKTEKNNRGKIFMDAHEALAEKRERVVWAAAVEAEVAAQEDAGDEVDSVCVLGKMD